jgi:hypothetical protein
MVCFRIFVFVVHVKKLCFQNAMNELTVVHERTSQKFSIQLNKASCDVSLSQLKRIRFAVTSLLNFIAAFELFPSNFMSILDPFIQIQKTFQSCHSAISGTVFNSFLDIFMLKVNKLP